MKIELLGESKIIMSNPESMHNYFGWPTVAKLQNGKIAVVSSGFRVGHVCPFGKAVISYSEDEGETYTLPAPVIDTVFDDRDAGIMTFGENGVMVTSFHLMTSHWNALYEKENPYIQEYVKMIPEETRKAIMGSNYRVSYDCGVTFGEIRKSPVTSPHGPVELQDGSILWVGHPYVLGEGEVLDAPIRAYTIQQDGTAEFVGEIPQIYENDTLLEPCEPHAIQLEDGTLLCHIRLHPEWAVGGLIVYQSESKDGGRTWTVPHKIAGLEGGAPAHLMKHSSGAIISAYGWRGRPSGIRAMISYDNGNTWDIDHMIYETNAGWDLGYPATIELEDGSLLTVFYARTARNEPAVIMQQKWRIVSNE